MEIVMQTIVLIMLRQAVAQGLFHKLNAISNVRAFYESDYEKAKDAIHYNAADVVLIEVAETGEYDVPYCLALCAKVRATNCKILLLCPEQDEASIAAVVEAKQNELIEDFMFYDASLDYLVSKLMSV